MKPKEEIVFEMLNSVKLETANPPVTGGQTVGIIRYAQRLRCDNLDVTIECGYFRSQIKNRELCINAYKLMLDIILDNEL